MADLSDYYRDLELSERRMIKHGSLVLGGNSEFRAVKTVVDSGITNLEKALTAVKKAKDASALQAAMDELQSLMETTGTKMSAMIDALGMGASADVEDVASVAASHGKRRGLRLSEEEEEEEELYGFLADADEAISKLNRT